MKELISLLQEVPIKEVIGQVHRKVRSLVIDSRALQNQDCFIAIRGSTFDSHILLNEISDRFSDLTIVCQVLPSILNPSITYIQVEDTRVALGLLARNFYDQASSQLKIVGVTGTNGKTTVASLLHQLFSLAGFSAGLISTVCVRIREREFPTTLTTPDAISLNAIFRQMVDAGCEYCFMEVSSHAADQKRIYGIPFAGGIFTNITHDHLDYHKTFENYLLAKQSFFNLLSTKAFALTNKDDKNGEFMVQNTMAQRRTYSLMQPADYKVQIKELHLGATLLSFQGHELWTQLTGAFNAYNICAVMAAALELGLELSQVLLFASQLTPIKGRFEVIRLQKNIYAVIDYAHTPDALENVLQSIHEVNHLKQKIITVVGCGGNRDKQKRPKMGKIAVSYSDWAIFTSDNPRDEDPMSIIEEMKLRLSPQEKEKVWVLESRKQAIYKAWDLAQKGGIILIAGKGHENYQEIKGQRLPFNDKQEILSAANLS
ncbi:MAG: UDP-N-acetylmuramoyl-L-alanyl-D-glutamate--2,6-diaminopimelate ligase [Bacteroidia bacterium]|nr:UDP-N-acetylmuramoyl-L-alanyl-D-glutamate--2,6-diaminopimelate ligase [Bacteroidia bacterium]MDW8157672.1 UDP-N-acetylmuramoyl-L-alanyl-D-glutamate--2,6-diaminopimelate ligase [Bacteroidia bacterium]